jgi:hypothetical protein
MVGFPCLALAVGLAANSAASHAASPHSADNGAVYIVAQKPRCAFRYDEKLETRVLSLLQHQLSSEGARFYDPKRPIVTVCRSKASLMFSGDLEPDGRSLLDPPHIYIDVDLCSHRILTTDRDDGMTVTDAPPCE